MRQFDTDDTYQYFLKRYYSSKYNMMSAFSHQKSRDKKGLYVNKKYIISNDGWYNENDIKEFLNFKIEQYNTITYAQQLIIDIEAIFDYYNLRAKSKLARILNIKPQNLSLDMSYETALKIIDGLKNRLLSMSPEALKDLKYNFNKVTNEA